MVLRHAPAMTLLSQHLRNATFTQPPLEIQSPNPTPKASNPPLRDLQTPTHRHSNAPARILLTPFRRGSVVPRFFQREYRPRPPPLVGTLWRYAPLKDDFPEPCELQRVDNNLSNDGRVRVGGVAVGEGGRWGGRGASWNGVTESVCASCKHFQDMLNALVAASSAPPEEEEDEEGGGHRMRVRAQAEHSNLCIGDPPRLQMPLDTRSQTLDPRP